MSFSNKSSDVFTVCSVGRAGDMVMRGPNRLRIDHDLCIFAAELGRMELTLFRKSTHRQRSYIKHGRFDCLSRLLNLDRKG